VGGRIVDYALRCTRCKPSPCTRSVKQKEETNGEEMERVFFGRNREKDSLQPMGRLKVVPLASP